MASADILRAAHAPLPWSVQRSAVSDRIVSVSAADSFGDVVALSGFASHITSYGDEASHNTEFVVRACNAHYQMLEALKVAQASLAMLTEPAHVRTSTVHQAWGQAVEAELKVRLAIAAAEAEAGR